MVSSRPITGIDYPSWFTQWVADNVDHSVITLDGRGTFHGMDIISSTGCMTAQAKFPKRFIPRLHKRLPSSGVIKNKGIRVVPYYPATKSGLISIFDEIYAEVATTCHFTTSYQFEPRMAFIVDFPRFVTQSNELSWLNAKCVHC